MKTKIKQIVKNILRRATGFYELKADLQQIHESKLQYSDELLLPVQRNLASLAQGIGDLHLRLEEITARLDNLSNAGATFGQAPGDDSSVKCHTARIESSETDWPLPEPVPLA